MATHKPTTAASIIAIRVQEVLDEELGPVKAAERIVELEQTLSALLRVCRPK